MKKIFLFLVGCILLSIQTFSQSQRLVLVEEFTNACCGPCASQNPAFDALLQANPTKITAIKYHTNWPGVDPMNTQNPGDVQEKVTYYSVTGVPYAALDGTPIVGSNYLGAPSNLTQQKIDAEYAIPSPLEISINHQLSATNDTIFVTMLIKATQAVSGNLVANIAVIEKHIHFNSPPGSNGEKDFYNVMKKLLPTKSGTTLPSSMAAGDYIIITTSWKLANVYNLSELSVVGFVQNLTNKSVLQAANSSTAPLTGIYANDAQITEVSNVLDKTCSGSLNPVVTVRNNGQQLITSFQVNYSVNNSSPLTYNWNGNLPVFGTTTIALPSIAFSLLDNNTLTIECLSPNGITDDYPQNNTVTKSFTSAPVAQNYVSLILRTDNLPQETTWDIKNSSGQVMKSGGPYTQTNHIYKDTLYLSTSDCYLFTIYDAGGNGICCTNGHGVYQLLCNDGTEIISGGIFNYQESAQFSHGSGSLTYSVSGAITYPQSTPLSGLTLQLKDGNGAVIASTTTNASGNYSFAGVPNGTYTISATTGKAWGGVSASDVLLFKKHIAGITSLTGIFLASGDVNGSGGLSASDVLLIKKRIATITNSFSVGDWLFNNIPVTVSNNNVTLDFNGLCYGDANASYTPPAK